MTRPYGTLRKSVDIGLLTCLSLGALFVGARIGLAPRDPAHGVAVVFAPWTKAARTVTQAVEGGARFVRFGDLPFIAVVVPDDGRYVDKMLSAGGAWLVVDPQILAACSNVFSFVR